MSLVPAIRIELAAESGRVREVAITATGPLSPAASFVGLPAVQVPPRAALLFALCPVAQSLAAEVAIAAARGETMAPDRKRLIALVAEHFRENLRSLVLAWPGLAPESATLTTLRAALSATQGLAELAPAQMSARLDASRRSVEALGFAANTPRRASWFGRLLHDVAIGREGAGTDELFLDEPGADGAVFESLAMSGEPPSGTANSAMPLLAHLYARGAQIDASIARLRRLAAGDFDETLCNAHPLQRGAGAAAVESPRGRLFHVARLDAAGRVAAYRTLSPTDRNFAVNGPLARTLSGCTIGTGAAAERRVAQIAALYDPCLAVDVRIREAAHA